MPLPLDASCLCHCHSSCILSATISCHDCQLSIFLSPQETAATSTVGESAASKGISWVGDALGELSAVIILVFIIGAMAGIMVRSSLDLFSMASS